MTPDTSGPGSQTPFAYYDPDSHSLRTSQLTLDLDSMKSSPTLPTSGSMRSGRLYERPTLALAINAIGSSSSQPCGGGVSLMPTPVVNDMGAGKSVDQWEALTAKWQAKFGNNGHGNSLSIEVAKLLPTPAASGNGLARNETSGRSNPDSKHHAGRTLDDVRVLDAWGKYAPAIDRWANVIDRPAPDPTDGQGRLNPALVEWMMGYPEGWTEGVSRTGQLKALGNAIVPHQAAAAWGHLLGLDVFAEAGGASPADSSSIRRQRTRTSRDRRTGSQDSDLPMIPTPTAWLGRRPSQSIGSADRWHNKARSRELSDFIAAEVIA